MLMYARELVPQGYIGEVLSVSFSSVSQAVTQRGVGRIWQTDRKNGANTLTIAAGHAIDALCFVVGETGPGLGASGDANPEWHNTDTGESVPVDPPTGSPHLADPGAAPRFRSS